MTVLHANQLGNEQLGDVRDEIFPFIRLDSFGDEESQMVSAEWLANLNVTYVIRIPSGFRYITEFDLKRWGVEKDELHQLAIANLCNLDTTHERPDFPAESLPLVIPSCPALEPRSLSASSNDKPFVRRLVGELKQRNVHLWFDERELQVGDSIVQGISAGLEDVHYLLVILSKNSVASPWVQNELNTAMMEQTFLLRPNPRRR